jgi:hypothetical protein
MWAWKPWKRVLTVMVGLAAIAYAFVTYWQWRDLRNNFMVEQRAWIRSSGYVFVHTVKTVTMRIDNTGKSPAFDIKLIAQFQILPIKTAPSFTIDDPTTGTIAPMFPGDHKDMVPVGPGDIFTDAENRAIANLQAYMLVFGYFTYSDQFGKHWTRFCEWGANPSPEHPSAVLPTQSCIAYNWVGDGDPPTMANYQK